MLRALPVLLLLSQASSASAAAWPSLETPAAGTPSSDDAALLVAVEHYVFVPAVPGASRNVEDWYAWLTRSRGIPASRVRLLRDAEATREQILAEAQAVAALGKPGAQVWVVFVGHGAPAPDGKDGLLVGADAQPTAVSLAARSVRQDELLGALLKGPQARTVAVIDACFSGKTAGGELVPSLQPLVPVVAAPTRALVLSAGKADQFAGPLPGLARPAFSYLALGALRGWGDANGDGKVTGEEVITFAREALQATVRDCIQTPEAVGPGAGEALVMGAKEKGPDLAAMAAAPRSELAFTSGVEYPGAAGGARRPAHHELEGHRAGGREAPR